MASVHLKNSAGYVQQIHARTHTLVADEPVAHGGTDAGPAPYELLLAGLAACTSLTLRMYADRKGWPLKAISVDLQFSRDDAGAESVTRRVEVEGALSDEQRRRLAEVCEKTPVTKSVKRGMTITTTLRQAATPAAGK